jgi:hypothetical protein
MMPTKHIPNHQTYRAIHSLFANTQKNKLRKLKGKERCINCQILLNLSVILSHKIQVNQLIKIYLIISTYIATAAHLAYKIIYMWWNSFAHVTPMQSCKLINTVVNHEVPPILFFILQSSETADVDTYIKQLATSQIVSNMQCIHFAWSFSPLGISDCAGGQALKIF